MVRITITAIEQLASDFNSVLKYFHGYWKTMKIFFSNIFYNEINVYYVLNYADIFDRGLDACMIGQVHLLVDT